MYLASIWLTSVDEIRFFYVKISLTTSEKGGPNKLFISHFQLHLFTCYKASKERRNLILVLSRIVHQSRRQHEWIIEERKQLFSSNGSWYCADHYQRYRLRFWITWKLPCLFSYCFKFSPTSSLQLPSIQLSDRWSNRHFGMWATLYWSHHPENILVRLHSGPAYCVHHFKLSFMYHLSLTYGGYQSWSICCRCASTETQKLHGEVGT